MLRLGCFARWGMARILKLQVYGPVRPGLLCTVEVVAAAGRGEHQNGLGGIRNLLYTSIESSDTNRQHWSQSATRRVFIDTRALGRFQVRRQRAMRRQEDVPEKTSQASVSGQPYGGMNPQDRWVNMWTGGEVTFERPRSSGVPTLPGNIHMNQEPLPGLRMDRWRYCHLNEWRSNWILLWS